MTPDQIREARSQLGALWGLGRPVDAAAFARVLRLKGKDPAKFVLEMESGKSPVSGPISLAVDLMLDGARPPQLAQLVPGVQEASRHG